MLVQLNRVRPRHIGAAEALAGALHPVLVVGPQVARTDVNLATVLEGVKKRRIPRGGHVGVRGAGHEERERSDGGELHRFAWCWCWCWCWFGLLGRRRGDAAC